MSGCQDICEEMDLQGGLQWHHRVGRTSQYRVPKQR